MTERRATRRVRPWVIAVPLLLVAALLLPSLLIPGGSDAKLADTLRAELLEFTTVQEAYRASQGRYAATYEDLWWHADTTPGLTRFRAASGASFKLNYADSLGFMAIARIAAQPRYCWIVVGPPREPRADEVVGTPYCNFGS